jgi:glycosyltransferase involved in cell wall biosynthesis
MRVALVTYGLHIGGMENFLFMLGNELRSREMDVAFVVTEVIGSWHQRAIDEGYEVIAVLPKTWRTRRWHVSRLASVLSGFDAVLLNHSAAGQALLGSLPSSCIAATILHNDVDEIYQIGLANATNVDHLVCVSSKILSEVKRRGAPAAAAIRIPHGIDVPPTWPKEGQSRNGRPLKVIFVGRVNHVQKGIWDIPPILSEVQRRGAQFTFEMVGDGEPELSQLRREFATKFPEISVQFHGRQSHADTLQLLSQADILLMPSRFEGLPITLLETLAQGVVPIASRLPGVTDDAVENGVNGILPEVGDIEGFARAIVRLQDDSERMRISQAAWQTARERFTKDLMVKQYLALLKSARRAPRGDAISVDSVGRELFGLSWFLPIGLAKAIRAPRTLYRRLGRLPSKLNVKTRVEAARVS